MLTTKSQTVNNHASMIWNIADVLRGSYRKNQYGPIIMPFTVLRRLECVLEPTKNAVVETYEANKDEDISLDLILERASGQSFYNYSPHTLKSIMGDDENMVEAMLDYINSFSEEVRDIFQHYKFAEIITELGQYNLLFHVISGFANYDLHPDTVSPDQMGSVFEEIIRKFAEESNETAGEHFTPREVIHLMVDILFATEDHTLQDPYAVRSIYDPTAGTGGMLSIAEDYIKEYNHGSEISLNGQEINPFSYAICKTDMIVRGKHIKDIRLGNTLTNDQHSGKTFNYVLSNPPFGVDWKQSYPEVNREREDLGENGRFAPGLPRTSDGSMLFLLHVLSKLRPSEKGGGRAGVVLNGSPLFTGAAGSGESDIRKYIIENDYLEAIIALPTDMFYNTGISTYVWILTNRKEEARKGTVQLIDGSTMFRKMRKILGSKRKEMSGEDITQVTKLYSEYLNADGEISKVFTNEDFGYRTITVERPLRLNFAVTEERIQRAISQGPLVKLSEEAREVLVDALRSMDSNVVWSDRKAFLEVLTPAVSQRVKLAGPAFKSLWQGLSERDENAEICTDKKGQAEADPELRDTENVPLREDILGYFQREVKPFVPDAWVDDTKTKVGYEIPFTKHFYKYESPRTLNEIDSDLESVLGRIGARLKAVQA